MLLSETLFFSETSVWPGSSNPRISLANRDIRAVQLFTVWITVQSFSVPFGPRTKKAKEENCALGPENGPWPQAVFKTSSTVYFHTNLFLAAERHFYLTNPFLG